MKMLRETEKKQKALLLLFLSWVAFQLGRRGRASCPSPPLAMAMTRKVHNSLVMGNSIHLLLAILLLDLQQKSSFAETFLPKIFFANFSKTFFQLSKLKDGCKIKF